MTCLRLLTYANWQEKVADPLMQFWLPALTRFFKEQVYIIIELAANAHIIYIEPTFGNDAEEWRLFSGAL